MQPTKAAKATKKTHTLSLQVPPDLIRGLRAMAKFDGRDHDEYLVEILTGAVDAYRGDRRLTQKAHAMGMTLSEYEAQRPPVLPICPEFANRLADGIAGEFKAAGLKLVPVGGEA